MAHSSLVAFDDFTPRAEEIRERALQQSFAPVEWKGHVYKGIGKDYDPDLFLQMEKVLGRPIVPALSYFRLEMEDDESTAWIHADTSVDATFACVLYLTSPLGGLQGTAFWRHKRLGLYGIPEGTTEQEEYLAEHGEELRIDCADESKWELSGVAGMKFNRMIMYPTRLFHSRYPKKAFGNTKETGRLIWVCFFNLA